MGYVPDSAIYLKRRELNANVGLLFLDKLQVSRTEIFGRIIVPAVAENFRTARL